MLTHYEEYSDVDLVRCYQKGDEKAGNVLCQRHWGALYRFFKKKIRNSEDAQDLVQETFFEALKTLKSGQPPRNFRSWFYKIAARVLGRWIKEQQDRDRQLSLDDIVKDESGNKLEQTFLEEMLLAPIMDEPEHGAVDTEFGDIRRRFEGTLSPKELAVFQLRQNSPMTFEEIGKALGIKPGTAKVRYHRTIEAFKVWLKKYYSETYSLLSGEGVNDWTKSYWLFSSVLKSV